MAENLTPQQRQAVEDTGGRLLVSAAAGSGKTKVLVDRLMRYLLDPVSPANIDDFLLITYTKAAASELRGKIAAKLAEKVAEDPQNRHLQRQQQRLYLAKISTVHSFCGDVLREYAFKLDLPADFRVADENECRQLREEVLTKLLADAYTDGIHDADFRTFIDTQGFGRDDRQIPQIIQRVYDSARCHLQPQDWLDNCLAMSECDGLTDASQTEYGAYLMQRLMDWLDRQIPIFQRCAQDVAAQDGCAKPAALLSDNVQLLVRLRNSQTWDDVVRNLQMDFGRLNFPKTCDPNVKDRMTAVRNACKETVGKMARSFDDPSDRVLADLKASSAAIRGLLKLVDQFSSAYGQLKRSRRVLDFGDLEHKMLDLLLGKQRTGITAAAHEIGERFREVMVDEYQDSNEVQDAIYDALTRRKQNLFMVGDVKQSIYQFRLADPGIFLQKYQQYLPAGQALPGQGRKVLLSQNFRSSGGVLSGCNDVFKLCMRPEVGGLYYGDDEALYEGIPHVSLPEPETVLCCVDVQQETYPEEAAFVADQIRQLLDGTHFVRSGDQLRPVQPEDIAILLRSPGTAGEYFQDALDCVGIRYATGGGEDLLSTPEVASLRSVLQAVHNPRLDIPLIAAMSSPIFGFTADDLAQIRSLDKEGCFYDALCMDERPICREFIQTLSSLRASLRQYSLTGLLEDVLLRTGLEDVYAAMEDGARKMQNIQTFCQLVADFEAGGSRDLGRFLEHLDAMEEKGLITAGEQTKPGHVTIMSIHKSKGLEFPIVFLCNLGRDFNTESQRADVLCHKDMGLGLAALDQTNRLRYPTIAKRAISARMAMEMVSEELRVLYVAMTRARDRLIMTYASDRLDKDIAYIVQHMDAENEEMLIRQAGCPGDWVLLTALHRTESGELFALGGKPEKTSSGTTPWQVRVVKAPDLQQQAQSAQQRESLPSKTLDALREGLAFRYAHSAATAAPSKMTATGLKGRAKDEEVYEHAAAPQVLPTYHWRRPGLTSDTSRGKEYGNAMHAAMQYIDYHACTDLEAVKLELQRLVAERYLSKEQGDMVRPEAIAAFFTSPLGQQIRRGRVEREFKFSILEDGAAFDLGLAGEQVLLQGVVDCALIEPDGITVVDFKTDYVTEDTIAAVADRYRPQVCTYAAAMEKICQKPVKQALLYFFHLGRFVAIQ